MKFTILSIIFAGLAAAQVIFTNSDFSGIEAGEPFTITWADATGPVTLTLMNGPADDLNTVSEITSGETGESFTWTPPESLPSGTYAFEISDGSDINYSRRFQIGGGAASGSSTISLTTATASATSTSVVTSTASSTTTSTATTESSSATMSSDSSSITGSVTTSSATTTMTTTRTSSRISAITTSGTPAVTEVPGTNGAQGVVAPLVAPFVVAVGAALF